MAKYGYTLLFVLSLIAVPMIAQAVEANFYLSCDEGEEDLDEGFVRVQFYDGATWIGTEIMRCFGPGSSERDKTLSTMPTKIKIYTEVDEKTAFTTCSKNSICSGSWCYTWLDCDGVHGADVDMDVWVSQ